MDVDGTLTVGGAVDFDDTFLVDGATTLDSTVEINGDITLENDETISNGVNGIITATATTLVMAGELVTTGGLDVQGNAITLESDDTIDNPSSGDITVAATTVTLDGEGVVTGGLDVQGGDITLQNDESISNATNGIITATATTIVAAGELVTTGGLDVQGGDIVLENDETIGNSGDGTILLTADSVDVSAGLDVDGLTDLDTVDIDDLVNIDRVTGTTGQYEDLIQATWTNSAADASYGSNGIYMQTDPIYDVQNVYGVRSRLDLRGATGGVSVNQLHGMDALINLNETQTYTVTDNISVYGAAVHGGTSNDVVAAGATGGSVNMYYGMWGDTADQNLSVGTCGMYLGSHAATYMDYGVVVANSGTMTAGLKLENHASNEPAIMAYGVYMSSASENMGDGINMEDADFTGDDIVLDSGETINNSTDGTILFTADDVSASGGLNVLGGLPGAGASGDMLDLTDTSGIMDGTDVASMIEVNMTGVDHTGTGNEMQGAVFNLTTPDVHARERAIVIEDTDWEMAIDTPIPVVATAQTWFDDFVGDVLNPTWVLLSGSDGGAVDPALGQQQYGVMVLDGGDAGTNVATDTSEAALGLHWSADQGSLVWESRMHINADLTDVRMCAGLTDSIDLEQPATIGGSDVVTQVAHDYAAFCYDTAGDTDVWFALSAAAQTPGTGAGATAVGATFNVYQVFRIEVDAAGAQARFYIDGTLVKTVTAGAITATDLLSPFVTCQSLAANTQTCDVDYIFVSAQRQ